MRAVRIDRGTLRSPRRTSAGALRVDGVFTRAGVFVYLNKDGTQRRELRPPDEVFRKDALESFQLVPITDDHPPELVRADNRDRYQRGMTGEDVRREDEQVVGSLVVTDVATINKMEAGKVGLSCGYEVELDETPGEDPRYGRYDAIQRNIRGNHLALVYEPRAGKEACVRMDAAVMRRDLYEGEDPMKCKDCGKAIGDDAKCPHCGSSARKDDLDAAKQLVGEWRARAEKAEATLAELRARADKAEGTAADIPVLRQQLEQARKDAAEIPRLQNESKALTAQIADLQRRLDAAEDPKRLQAAVRKRVMIEASAALILDKKTRIDGLDNRTVMLAVLERTGRDANSAKERSDEYVEALFEEAVRGHHLGERGLDQIRERADREAAREDRVDPESARKKMIARNRGQEKE
jgi:hypothetical protein